MPTPPKGAAPFIAVTIGRNVGQSPMPPQDWDAFNQAVSDALTTAGLEVTAHNKGTGAWDGTPEDNAVVLACDFTGRLQSLDAVTSDLAALSHRFNQDAVAVATGGSWLVGGDS